MKINTLIEFSEANYAFLDRAVKGFNNNQKEHISFYSNDCGIPSDCYDNIHAFSDDAPSESPTDCQC